MRQMLKSNTTGETLVVDLDSGTAGEYLHHSDRELPLEDYCLDNETEPGEYDDGWTVIRRDNRPPND